MITDHIKNMLQKFPKKFHYKIILGRIALLVTIVTMPADDLQNAERVKLAPVCNAAAYRTAHFMVMARWVGTVDVMSNSADFETDNNSNLWYIV